MILLSFQVDDLLGDVIPTAAPTPAAAPAAEGAGDVDAGENAAQPDADALPAPKPCQIG